MRIGEAAINRGKSWPLRAGLSPGFPQPADSGSRPDSIGGDVLAPALRELPATAAAVTGGATCGSQPPT